MRSRLLRSSKQAGRQSGRLRLLANAQGGFTIIEVVVSAVLVASLAGAAATALIATTSFSGDQRERSQADELAQQDQERMKGMSIQKLAGYNETRYLAADGSTWTSSSTGTKFVVLSTGKFISNTGSSSCSTSGSSAAAYALVVSSVNWQGNMKAGADVNNTAAWTANSVRPPIKQESLIAPPTGGTLLTNVIDQNGAPLPGASVNIFGPKENESATTGSEGCAIFGGLSPTGYYVGVQKTGFVDPDGNDYPFGGVTVTATGTSFPTPNPFKLGQAGAVQATFTSNSGALTGQQAPSLSASNAGRTNPLITTPASPATSIATTQTLFPFNNGTSGVYTSNYSVWAGACAAEQPPTANRVAATVGPGVTAAPAIKEPGLKLLVTYGGVRKKPGFVKLEYSQTSPTACTESWFPPIAANGDTNTNGSLVSPGQPYAGSYAVGGTTYTGTYRVCAGYDPDGAGSGPMYYGTLTSQTLTNFSALTSKTVAITSSSTTTNPCP